MVSRWKEEEKRDTRGKKQRENKETRYTHTLIGSFGKE